MKVKRQSAGPFAAGSNLSLCATHRHRRGSRRKTRSDFNTFTADIFTPIMHSVKSMFSVNEGKQLFS